MKVLLSVNVKDERNILEWIVYHLAIGFDEILLFDDFSEIPLYYLEDKFSQVKVVREKRIKTDYMDVALRYARMKNYDYTIHLDGDEYFYLRIHKTIQEFIQSFPSNTKAIVPHWVFFGSNYLTTNPKNTLMDVYTRSDPVVNLHIKTLTRPDNTIRVKTDPHTYWFIDSNLNNIRDATYSAADNLGPLMYHFNNSIEAHVAYIAHYHHQSWEDHDLRHIRRRRDDLHVFRSYSKEYIENFHKMHNDIDNFDLKNKFEQLDINICLLLTKRVK